MIPLIRAFKGCGNRHRIRLLKAVLSTQGPVRQSSLVASLKIPQFLATRYLQLLVEANLLMRERKGLAVRYRKSRNATPEVRRLQRLIHSLPAEYFDISARTLERLAK